MPQVLNFAAFKASTKPLKVHPRTFLRFYRPAGSRRYAPT